MSATAATETLDIQWTHGGAATYEAPFQPSRALFEHLAARDPRRLLDLIVSRELAPAHMTFAAEIAGRSGYAEAVVVLLPLLEDIAPLVREGAIYGLEPHIHIPAVRTAILRLTNPANESSAGVRTAAAEALDLP